MASAERFHQSLCFRVAVGWNQPCPDAERCFHPLYCMAVFDGITQSNAPAPEGVENGR